VLAGLVLGPVAAVLALGGGDVYAYQRNADALEAQWQQMEAAGVPASRLAPLQHRLSQLQASTGSVPSEAVSGALFEDPLAALEARTRAIYDQVENDARRHARVALAALETAYGPTPYNRAELEAQLQRARQPRQLEGLARHWTDQVQQIEQARSELADRSQGLHGGLPADILSAAAQIQRELDQLQRDKLWTAPGPSALQSIQSYLHGSYAQMLAEHEAVEAEAAQAASILARRVELAQEGTELEGKLPGLLGYAGSSDDAVLAQQARAQFAAATTDDQLRAAVTALQSVVSDLTQRQQAVLDRLAAGTDGCIPGNGGKTIIVSLSQQRLLACQDGTAYLSTLVTTGQPALPTPTGHFTILAKYPSYYMVSLCRPGTYCWYPSTWVYDAMEFSPNYFIHSWWEPSYGPGTEDDLTYASHGCIHVPMGALQTLFDWAPVGTPVIIVN
jgi:lipoprotein-anchoring transpeptidase ErfK/SrfK